MVNEDMSRMAVWSRSRDASHTRIGFLGIGRSFRSFTIAVSTLPKRKCFDALLFLIGNEIPAHETVLILRYPLKDTLLALLHPSPGLEPGRPTWELYLAYLPDVNEKGSG